MIKQIIVVSILAATLAACNSNNNNQNNQINMLNYTKTASGLEYAITETKNGEKPQKGDVVVVHYTGKLTNDTVFDSSHKRNQPFQFDIGNGRVIQGWEEGIALLGKGDKATLRIPPHLGYGERDMGTIPANSTLIFEVELLDIIKPAKPYNTTGITPITTKSGLKYFKINETQGVQAAAGKKVTVHYTGYLANGTKFDSSVDRGQPFKFNLGQGQVIAGWDEGIALLKVGEKAKLEIPANLGYGSRPVGPIPANSTLIFDVELLQVD